MSILGRRGWLARSYRRLRAKGARPRVLVPIVTTAAFAVGLLVYAGPQRLYLHGVALEIGGDLIGAIIVIAILTPLIARAQYGRIRERGHLDYDLFTDDVAAATSVIRILDTFSNLFDRPQTPNALRAFEEALSRHAQVQILLLHPDSTAAALRAEELHHDDIRQEIMRNLRVLGEFSDQLDPQTRRRFEVRLYAASASNTLYRWDDRALISFLSLGRLSGDGMQLEIVVDSSLGRFVERHFDDLWHSTSTISLPDYRHRTIALRDDQDGPTRQFALNYVKIDGVYYFATDPEALVLAHLARVPATGGTVIACWPNRPDERLHIRVVDDGDERLRETLIRCFTEKYGFRGQAFLYLEPQPFLEPQPE